eukprot:gene24175-29349_t
MADGTPLTNEMLADMHCALGDEQCLVHHNNAKAIKQYQNASNLSPSNPKPHVCMAVCYVQLNRTSDALKCYHAAYALDPTYKGVEDNLLDCYCTIGSTQRSKGDIEGACKTYRAGLETFPQDMTLNYNLGNALLHGGRLDEALVSYKAAEVAMKTRGFDKPHAYNKPTDGANVPRGIYENMAGVHFHKGDLHKALKMIKKAHHISPTPDTTERIQMLEEVIQERKGLADITNA